MNGKWWFAKVFFWIVIIGGTCVAFLLSVMNAAQGPHPFSKKLDFWGSVKLMLAGAQSFVQYYFKLLWPMWPFFIALVILIALVLAIRNRRRIK